jgi:hypothetical protein
MNPLFAPILAHLHSKKFLVEISSAPEPSKHSSKDKKPKGKEEKEKDKKTNGKEEKEKDKKPNGKEKGKSKQR